MKSVKEALRARLVAAGVNGGTAIYDTLAPSGEAYPYVLLQYVGGGYENLSRLDVRNELWQVKAVTNDHDEAHTLAEAISTALHRQALNPSGWTHLWTVQVEHIWLTESAAREQIYHAGGTFRLRLHRQS